MDCIRIINLKIPGRHGVYEFEKDDVNTQDEKFTKDGIHLVFAVKMNRNLQFNLREIMIEKTKLYSL